MTIDQVLPKELQDFAVGIRSHNGQDFNITELVSEINIYESIHEHFLSGTMVIIDNSAMYQLLPVLGQEVLTIYFKYKDHVVNRTFYVSYIKDIKQLNENVGAYVIEFVDKKQIDNVNNTFSRSYTGRNTEIIANIHEDFLNEPIEVIATGGSSHQVVYPYTKPYKAMSMLLKHTFAIDNTPMFLYETLNEEGVKLQSLGDMWAQQDSDVVELRNVNQVNTDESGQGARLLPEQNMGAEDIVTKRSFNTLRYISNGSFAANLTTLDLSKKFYSEEIFDYKEHAPMLGSYLDDYISPDYKYDEMNMNELKASKHMLFVKNGLAYESDAVGNVYEVDSINKASFRSYANRMQDVAMLVTSDSNPTLTVGKLIDINLKRFTPNLGADDDRDEVNSGKYLCTAIKHTIKRRKYTITLELVRNGINKGAET